jgi:hypothetical protein
MNVQVVSCPLVGERLVATRAFAAGEVVHRERPLLVWREGEVNNDAVARVLERDLEFLFTHGPLGLAIVLKKKPAWVAWQAAPSDAKQAVLEKTQTLCADPGSSVAQALAAIAEDAVERSVLTSAVLNSYAFEGATEALFAVGGKAEHSCAPNAKFGVAAKGGEWRALRAIAAGEPVFHIWRPISFLKAPRSGAKHYTGGWVSFAVARFVSQRLIRLMRSPLCSCWAAVCAIGRRQKRRGVLQKMRALHRRFGRQQSSR